MTWEPVVISAAASVAGLVYLGREVRKLAKVITFWSGLPAAHKKLEQATKANTVAIGSLDETVGELVVQVAHLAQVERARGGGL